MQNDVQTQRPAERVPQAAYRLQFHEGFRIRDALQLVPYLHELGVSHLYSSPLFKARPHSVHGYDTCDFSQVNPELGTESGLAELVEALHARGMGLVLDIVPNHMGVGGPENRWWWDVLTHGRESRFAKFFDIGWESPDPRMRNKVLVPVLRDRYHQVLKKRELQLEPLHGGWVLKYGDSSFPINPSSLKKVKGGLGELNSNPDALDTLIEQQCYRLTSFARASRELNYRHFFSISDLAALRMENEPVFDQVHALVRRWLERGWLDGLRVDHPDGLRDPEQFLRRLRKTAPKAWIVVEKILGAEEFLPISWPVAGDTGYHFLNRAGGLFIDPAGEKPLTDFYAEFTGRSTDYAGLARDKKRLALQTVLAGDVERLAGLLVGIAALHWRYRDFSREELAQAAAELAACFPVYRGYIRDGDGPISQADAQHVATAASQALANRPDLPPELFEFLTDLLLSRLPGELEADFVARFQQLTPPAMAKGVEDNAFYCFNRFVALNEVGGNPARFGISVEEFHRRCGLWQSHWPAAMLATSTHDTKRSEDVRARLSLLSEIPDTWRQIVLHWSALNARHRRDGQPDRNAEYLYYQTLVGAWPLSVERALAYMEKAAREAGEHTSWTNANAGYESALRDFVVGTLDDPQFREALEDFVVPMLQPGYVNSLAQTLLKLTVPGVPDIYQGNELWELSLVDPDNRRPVDFQRRQELMAKVTALSAAEAWQEWDSGMPKLWLLRRVLHLRRRRPELFSPAATYHALCATGGKSRHAVAFKRGENLIAVVPRLVIGLRGDWGDTTLELPPGNWRAEFTGENVAYGPVPLRDLLRAFPVALLVREENP
jgi:(1->4)-alpha-D-glucan 1-alpha-D-glucosylmutase